MLTARLLDLPGQVYNIAADTCYSNIEIARQLLKEFGLQDKESEYLEFVSDRLFNDRRFALFLDFPSSFILTWSSLADITSTPVPPRNLAGNRRSLSRKGLPRPVRLPHTPLCCLTNKRTYEKCEVEWYKNPENWDNWIAPVESALVPHPRVG